MLNKIYFCLFCSQKYNTSDENRLKNHLIIRHFDGNEDPVVERWIESLVSYQTELNLCLSSDPKSLPKSSMCQSAQNNGKQKLLKGCGLCDKIIDCFKLDINLVNKPKNVCICDKGREDNKVVVICHKCNHMYHYQCVEPTDYSGEETSLYKCLKCKKKDFEISDLSSETQLCQPIHVSLHFNYQPFVCKVRPQINGRTVECNESFFRINFFKTHLKSEHKLTPNETQIENYYDLHSIPKVQHLIDSSLKKLSQSHTNNRSVGPLSQSAQSSSAQSHRLSQEFADNSTANKKLRIESNVQSVRGGGQQTTRGSSNSHNSNAGLGPPPVIEPVSSDYRNHTLGGPPQLAPAVTTVPPVLVNQSNLNTSNKQNSTQMPNKRGRGRPKGSKSKTAKKGNSNGLNGRQMIPNCYVADGNPQLKSRLSEKSRLSRPNISLSREEERDLHNKRSKTNGNEMSYSLKKDGDESSDWDSETEMYETMRHSDQPLTYESHVYKSPQNQRLSIDSSSPSNHSIVCEDILQDSRRSSSYSLNGEHSPSNSSDRTKPMTHNYMNPTVSTSQSTQVIGYTGERPVVHKKDTKEDVFDFDSQNDSEMSEPNDELTNNGTTLSTQITRVEASLEERRVDNMISSPINDLQNEEPINESISQSDWLTHTKPKKFPYFPQIDDEVVYIPYGHKQYIETVRKLSLYPQTNPTKFVGNKYIDKILFARVRDIKFEKQSNVRLVRLGLRIIDDNIETKQTFNVKFHDIDNVLDFIILKQTWNNSFVRNWKLGDSFRAIIDEKWWFGKIDSFNLSNPNCVATHFQALNIVWGNGTTDLLSYWDLEPLPVTGKVPQDKTISIDVTDEDRALFYLSEVQEWPVYGKEEECKRIAKGLDLVIQLSEYKQLMDALNHSKEEYTEKVGYLINLEIVRSRVRNMFYRRHAAVKYDIKLLETSIKSLDPSGAKGVLTNARIVVAVALKFIDKHRTQTIDHIYGEVMSDPSIPNKIKFYSCSRPNLNPNPNITNPLVETACAQFFNFDATDVSMNILTPSTTRTIVNKIRRSNDSNISVIELSDSEDDSNENINGEDMDNEDPEQRDQEMVSPTVPDSLPVPPVQSVEVLPITQTKSCSQTSKPVVPVRAQPIEERILTNRQQQTSDVFQRYFCIFCSKKFADRDQAMDHYFSELKVKLECSQCPLNTKFDSLEDYSNHNSVHNSVQKSSVSFKTYINTKSWIEKITEYMDTLLSLNIIQNQIDPKYGDCCVVCKRLNLLTPDSQPFFHKSYFANNRQSMKSSDRDDSEFADSVKEFAHHMRNHLKYEPHYNCAVCSDKSKSLTSAAIDDSCREHLRSVHQIDLAQASEVTSFFSSNKIPTIDNIIPDAVNLFIINYSNY